MYRIVFFAFFVFLSGSASGSPPQPVIADCVDRPTSVYTLPKGGHLTLINQTKSNQSQILTAQIHDAAQRYVNYQSAIGVCHVKPDLCQVRVTNITVCLTDDMDSLNFILFKGAKPGLLAAHYSGIIYLRPTALFGSTDLYHEMAHYFTRFRVSSPAQDEEDALAFEASIDEVANVRMSWP